MKRNEQNTTAISSKRFVRVEQRQPHTEKTDNVRTHISTDSLTTVTFYSSNLSMSRRATMVNSDVSRYGDHCSDARTPGTPVERRVTNGHRVFGGTVDLTCLDTGSIVPAPERLGTCRTTGNQWKSSFRSTVELTCLRWARSVTQRKHLTQFFNWSVRIVSRSKLSQPDRKHSDSIRSMEENCLSFYHESHWTKEDRLSWIDRRQLFLMQGLITCDESISTFFHQSKRLVSLQIPTISHRQRRQFEFLELIGEKCFLLNDGSTGMLQTSVKLTRL